MEHILDDGEPQVRATRQRKPSNDTITRATVDIALMAAFQGIGTCLTVVDPEHIDRPWWRLSSQDVSPIATPLTRYIESLPAHIRKKIDQYSMPVALLIGTIEVVGKPIRMESEVARLKKEVRNNVRQRPVAAGYQSSMGSSAIPSTQGGSADFNAGSAAANNGHQYNVEGRSKFRSNALGNGNEPEDL